MSNGELHHVNFQAAGRSGISGNSDGPGGSPAGPQVSLEFQLMAATRHAECGEWQAFVTAMCDVVATMHSGHHEQISGNRMLTHLRNIGGLEYTPPEAA